jgi:hypothetical protein
MSVFGFAGWLVASGAVWYVDVSVCPVPGTGSPGDPFCTIQDGICAASSGDTVSVSGGTYPESIRMKPSVAVVSEQGALLTTIDATGQPCTESDYCTKRTGDQCSAVIFSSGHNLTSVLDGFTVTGGAGVVQTNWVAGGGVFVASTATVVNNIITNNVLTGPLPQGEDLRGAGIYISRGQGVISNNTITGNRAVPSVGGGSGDVTFGYGGGIWMGFLSAAQVRGNVISDNVAGDPNLDFSLGSGGGVVLWTPGGTISPVVDRNVIADNESDSQGGGLSLLSRSGTEAEARVTNNVFVGNTSRFGGGVYMYFNRSTTINNTIVGNEAFLGGGVYTGQGDPNLPMTITNNVIEGNTLRTFGAGGGIYSLDLSATFDPVIEHNDLFNNEREDCGGERGVGAGAPCVGVDGNFSADPMFIDPNSGDYHLDPNSPAIDTATPTGAPAEDADGVARGVDGDGMPNSPVMGDVDVGAFEFDSCLAAPEVCDGADNDCNQLIDEGFPDTDLDGLADCVDPDDDDDLAVDESDCAPLDATAFGIPLEVSGIDVIGAASTTVGFDLQVIGSGTTYDVISGLLSRIVPSGGFQEGFCLQEDLASSPWFDPRPDPPVGDGWFYFLYSKNACGVGTLGRIERDAPGTGDVCAAGVVDGDIDGSPSDLDCNDADPTLSPINPEICDGVDNNCDTIADEGNPGGGMTCGVSALGECQRGTTYCVGGAIVCEGEIGPGPEFCDGLDNDCDGTADNNVIDTDLDGMDDCTDTDDDNDLVEDGSDCAPLDPSAFGVPTEVTDVATAPGVPTSISWTDQAIGAGTQYDLAGGTLSMAGILNFPSGTCLSTISASPAVDTRPDPAQGEVFYYLVRSRNACGIASFGSVARDTLSGCP